MGVTMWVLAFLLIVVGSGFTFFGMYRILSDLVRSEISCQTAEWEEIRSEAENATAVAMRAVNTAYQIHNESARPPAAEASQTAPIAQTVQENQPDPAQSKDRESDAEEPENEEEEEEEAELESECHGRVRSVVQLADWDGCSVFAVRSTGPCMSPDEPEDDADAEDGFLPESSGDVGAVTGDDDDDVSVVHNVRTELEPGEVIEDADSTEASDYSSDSSVSSLGDSVDAHEPGAAQMDVAEEPYVEETNASSEPRIPSTYILRKMSIEELRAFVVARHPDVANAQKLKRAELEQIARDRDRGVPPL